MKNKILEQLLRVSSIPHLYKNVQITHLPTKKNVVLAFDVIILFDELRFTVPPKHLTITHINLIELSKIVLSIRKIYPSVYIGSFEADFDFERKNKNSWIISFNLYPKFSTDAFEEIQIQSEKIIFDHLIQQVYQNPLLNERRFIN